MSHHNGRYSDKSKGGLNLKMQEEVTNKTIALVFRTTKLTAETLKKAIQMYLEYQKGKMQNNHGKISVKKLVGQNAV